MISVVLPVFNNINLTKDCLDSIVKNDVKPDEIIIIDDASTDDYYSLLSEYDGKLNIFLKRNEENVGVNETWNQGFSISKNPYITVLNNDVILNPLFFKKVLYVMDNFKDVGICVPYLHRGNPKIIPAIDEDPILEDEKYIMGWAYTIRREIVDIAGKIPPVLRIFQGDAFLFLWAKKLGFSVRKIVNNKVFHYGSKTVKMDEKWFETFQKESRLWTPIRTEIEKRVIW